MGIIIMMHGLPLAGKSTAAAKIKKALESEGISAEIVKSVATRYGEGNKVLEKPEELIDERIEKTRREKDDSYKRMCNLAAEQISEGNLPILDATFHKRRRREWVYELSRKKETGVIIIWVQFDDEDRIRSMLDERKRNHDLGDNILCEWEQYSIMKSQFKPLDEKEQRSRKIVIFDRKNKNIRLYNCRPEDSLISMICGAVNDEQ